MDRVNRTVDDEPRLVHAVRRAAGDVAVAVDPDQGPRGDLLEEQAEGVEQKLVLGAGDSCRDVRVVEIGPAVQGAEAVGGGQIAAHRPFIGRDFVRNPVRRVRIRYCGHLRPRSTQHPRWIVARYELADHLRKSSLCRGFPGPFRSRKTGPREATLIRKWGRTSLGCASISDTSTLGTDFGKALGSVHTKESLKNPCQGSGVDSK